MSELNEVQREMLRICLNGSAWVTARGSPNDTLLAGWAEKGWAEEVDAPAPTLIAYSFTNKGRSKLTSEASS